MKICPFCNNQIQEDDSATCSFCGKMLNENLTVSYITGNNDSSNRGKHPQEQLTLSGQQNNISVSDISSAPVYTIKLATLRLVRLSIWVLYGGMVLWWNSVGSWIFSHKFSMLIIILPFITILASFVYYDRFQHKIAEVKTIPLKIHVRGAVNGKPFDKYIYPPVSEVIKYALMLATVFMIFYNLARCGYPSYIENSNFTDVRPFENYPLWFYFIRDNIVASTIVLVPLSVWNYNSARKVFQNYMLAYLASVAAGLILCVIIG